MIFPKPVMSITELEETGFFKRTTLKALVHSEDQDFAFTTANGGKWMIDTAKLGAYLERRTQLPSPRKRDAPGTVRRRRKPEAAMTCRQVMKGYKQ